MTDTVTSQRRVPWFARVISRTAANPSGWLGRVLARIWVTELAAVNDEAVRLLDPQPGWRVLEVGFGAGRTIGRLVDAGAHVVGVDISPQMVAVAGRRNLDGVRDGVVELHQGDGTDLPAADGTVDGAISVHTLYFWPDQAAVARELARVLRPGGRLVLGIRDPELPPSPKADPSVYSFVPLEDVRRLLVAAGFADVDVVRTPRVSDDAVWIVAIRRYGEVSP